MQTYEPSSPGMIICISGGGYVKTDDHLTALEAKDREIKELKAELSKWNPCGHTGFESVSCEICGYPSSVKYIAALTESLKTAIANQQTYIDRIVEKDKEISAIHDEYSRHWKTPDEKDKEIADLKRWKKEALMVTPPLQEIAKVLDIRWGESIHDKILPGIIKIQAKLSRLTVENADLKAKYEGALDEVEARGKTIARLGDKLSRLTSTLNDDERAEKVIGCREELRGEYECGRAYGIDDYRADIKKELI